MVDAETRYSQVEQTALAWRVPLENSAHTLAKHPHTFKYAILGA